MKRLRDYYKFEFKTKLNELRIYQNKKDSSIRFAICTDPIVEETVNKSLKKYDIFQAKRFLLKKGWMIK